MDEMFKNYKKLNELILLSFDTTNVTSMESMLSNCCNLTNLLLLTQKMLLI